MSTLRKDNSEPAHDLASASTTGASKPSTSTRANSLPSTLRPSAISSALQALPPARRAQRTPRQTLLPPARRAGRSLPGGLWRAKRVASTPGAAGQDSRGGDTRLPDRHRLRVALVLPRSEASRLNLTVLGRVPIIGVRRMRSVADIAELEVEWLGETRAVEVIISGGDDSLLETNLLDGSRLVIDYVNYTVTVSDEE